MGLAVAAVATLGLTTGEAAADVVALSLDPAEVSASTDVVVDTAGAPDPFAELLNVGALDAQAHDPLFDLLGMPRQPVRRGRSGRFTVTASVDHPSTARAPDMQRFGTSPSPLDEVGDGVAALGRQAFEVFQRPGDSEDETERVRMYRPTPSRELHSSAAGLRPAEVQDTWLREGLLLLRSNREWVLAGVIALLSAIAAHRLFAHRRAAAGHRRRRRRSRLAR